MPEADALPQTANIAPPLPAHVTKTMAKLAKGVGRNPIEIGFTIYSLTDVDPVEQTFNADLKVFCRWHDGGMEQDPDMIALRTKGAFANGQVFERDEDGRFPHYVVKDIDYEIVEQSAPHYHFANASDVEVVEGTHVVYLSPNDKPGFVRSEQRYRGSFFQMMQLAAFPFDAQTLKMAIRLPRRSDSGRTFVQFHHSRGPQVEMKDWVRLAEWYRYEPSATTSVDSKGRAKYTISVPLVRKYDYYVWSILGVIGSISFLSFVSFAINADDLPGRSSLVVTLLLTAVAFKLVISDVLPKVSYLDNNGLLHQRHVRPPPRHLPREWLGRPRGQSRRALFRGVGKLHRDIYGDCCFRVLGGLPYLVCASRNSGASPGDKPSSGPAHDLGRRQEALRRA